MCRGQGRHKREDQQVKEETLYEVKFQKKNSLKEMP